MRLLRIFCLVCLATAGPRGPGSAWAAGDGDVVIVVDARSGVERLERDDAINIFLGRHRVLPDGMAARPVDHPVASRLYEQFYRRLVDKTPAEIGVYWSRLYFSGKTLPPPQINTPAAAIAHVLGTPGGIACLERAQVDGRLRVVLALPPTAVSSGDRK